MENNKEEPVITRLLSLGGNYYGYMLLIKYNDEYYTCMENWDETEEDVKKGCKSGHISKGAFSDISKEVYDCLYKFEMETRIKLLNK